MMETQRVTVNGKQYYQVRSGKHVSELFTDPNDLVRITKKLRMDTCRHKYRETHDGRRCIYCRHTLTK